MPTTNLERVRAFRERKRKGEIPKCKQHPPYTAKERMQMSRKKHPEMVEAKKKGEFETKIKILTHYGNGKCACVNCHEARPACLSLDHIDGRGYEQKQKGYQLYQWLIKSNYPEGYQTLCMNCQWVKRFEQREHRRSRQ